jgi:4-amino-4-deoxy-L-arabinose transferase-like glycosyltransferase
VISLVHLPTFIILVLIGWAGRRDGSDGVYARTLAVLRLVGKRPTFSPNENAAHKQREADLTIDPAAPTWRERIEALTIELTTLPRAATLLIAFLFLLGVEFVGDLQLLNAAGMSEGKRLIVAPALALAIFGFTEVIFEVARRKNKWLFWIVMITACGVVFFLTAVQFDTVATDDGDASQTATIGLAVLLSLTIVGPSALAAYIIKKAREVWPKVRERAELRRWLRKAEARVAAAKRYIANLAAWGEWWDQRVTRLENQYDYTFKRSFMRHHNDRDELQQHLAAEPSFVPSRTTATVGVALNTPPSPPKASAQIAASERRQRGKKDDGTIHPFVRHLATPHPPVPNPYEEKKS